MYNITSNTPKNKSILKIQNSEFTHTIQSINTLFTLTFYHLKKTLKMEPMKMNMRKIIAVLLLPLAIATSVNASAIKQTKGDFEDKFRQLDEALPTPNVYRNASGEPGENY